MITILDYGSGNLNAIKKIYERLNISFEFANTKEQNEKADHILLPGVGAFDETISTLQTKIFIRKRAMIMVLNYSEILLNFRFLC